MPRKPWPATNFRRRLSSGRPSSAARPERPTTGGRASKPWEEIAMSDDDVRVALRRHWEASDANDFATEHQIYRDDAVLDYPQSGERIRGRANIQASRTAQPNLKRFTVRRMLGSGGLWVTEYIIYYDEKPFHTVSIMEFR